MPSSSPRYLLYSHDTYGLGHFRRSVLLARGIVTASPEAHVLIATGSPRAQAFSLPDRVDSLKLPTVTKDGAGNYQPRKITSSIDELVDLRSSVLHAACLQFRPDVVLVDQAPTGMAGELIPLLRSIDSLPNRPRLVLGLREIVDDATTIDSQWQSNGTWQWLDRYDDVLVYGDERLITTAQELDLDTRLRARVTHTGFVAPVMPERFAAEPFVLVTGGGGGDGQQLMRGYLDAVEAGAIGGVRSLIVTGPLMSASRRAELEVRAEQRRDLEIIDFSADMRQLVASASGVVSMAGYNTVVEELAAGVPALLVPRTAPRMEQDIRARRLGPYTKLERCPIDQLSPMRLAAFLERAVAEPASMRARTSPFGHLGGVDLGGVDLGGVDLGGVGRAASLLTEGVSDAVIPSEVRWNEHADV